MNRYAPELALITGGLLGGVFGGFVLFVAGEFYSAAVVCALFGYPFAAYAVHTDPEPSTVLRPRAVTAIAAIVAVGVVVDTLRLFGPSIETLLVGSLLAVGIFLPVAAYATQYGEPPTWCGPRRVDAGCSLLAVGLLSASVATGVVAGAASAVAVYVAGVLYGGRSAGTDRLWVAPVGGFVVAGGLLAIGVVTEGSIDRWMTGALAAAFGPLIALAVNTARAE